MPDLHLALSSADGPRDDQRRGRWRRCSSATARCSRVFDARPARPWATIAVARRRGRRVRLGAASARARPVRAARESSWSRRCCGSASCPLRRRSPTTSTLSVGRPHRRLRVEPVLPCAWRSGARRSARRAVGAGRASGGRDRLSAARDCGVQYSEPAAVALLGWKAMLVAVDLLSCLVLLRLARARGVPTGRVIAYAWNPLVVLEVAGMGHVDALGVLPLLVAALFLVEPRPKDAAIARRRAAAAGAALALAILAKLVPLLLVPAWARASARRAAVRGRAAAWCSRWRPLPFAIGAPGVPPGLVTYAVSWEWNGPAVRAAVARARPRSAPCRGPRRGSTTSRPRPDATSSGIRSITTSTRSSWPRSCWRSRWPAS